jgi:hypothetical protein
MAGLVSGGVDLDATREKIEASVPKEHRRGFDSIMAAGMKAMFSDKTFPKMQEYVGTIKDPSEIPTKVAHGISKVMSILMNMSKGHMPMEPSGAAAQSLMTHALDYLQTVKKIPIDKDTLAATTKATNQGMMTLLQQYSGLDEGQFEQVLRGKGKELIEQGQQAQPAADPAAQPQPGMGA